MPESGVRESLAASAALAVGLVAGKVAWVTAVAKARQGPRGRAALWTRPWAPEVRRVVASAAAMPAAQVLPRRRRPAPYTASRRRTSPSSRASQDRARRACSSRSARTGRSGRRGPCAWCRTCCTRAAGPPPEATGAPCGSRPRRRAGAGWTAWTPWRSGLTGRRARLPNRLHASRVHPLVKSLMT